MQLFPLEVELVILFQLPGALKCPSKMWAEALALLASTETIWLSLDRAVVAIQVKHFASSHQNQKKRGRFGVCGDAARLPCGPFPRRRRCTSDPSCPCCCFSCQILPRVVSVRKHFPQASLMFFMPRYWAIPFISGILSRLSVWWLQQLLVSQGTFSLENRFKFHLQLLC